MNYKQIPFFKNRELRDKIKTFKEAYPVETSFNQDGLEIKPSHISLSNKYAKSYYLHKTSKNIGYQNIVTFFNFHLNSKGYEYDYSIKMTLQDLNSVLLYKQTDTEKNNIESHLTIPIFGGSKAVAQRNIENLELIEDKVADGDQVVNLTYIVTIFAKTETELKQIDEVLQTKFQTAKWDFFSPSGGQKEAFSSSLPIPVLNPPHSIKMLASDIARLILPTSTTIAGVLAIGIDILKGSVYRFNLFEGDRMHPMTITGTNGSGKSAFAKVFFELTALFGLQRMYFDTEGECSNLAKATYSQVISVNSASGGVNIIYFDESLQVKLTEDEQKKFNLLDVHINWLISVLFMFPCWDEKIRNVRTDLNDLLLEFYQSTNKIQNAKDISEKRNMRELCQFLDQKIESFNSKNDNVKLENLKLIQLSLSNFHTGLYKNYFASEKEFNFNHDSIIFDLSGNEDEHLRKVFAYILLYKSFQKMLTADRGRILFIDELHMFLKLEGFSDLLIQYLKRCRKYNGSFVLITQELDELSPYPALLKEVSYHCIFSQQEIKNEIIKLSEGQKNEIAKLKVGSCIILNNKNYLTSKVKIILNEKQKNYAKPKATLNSDMNTFDRYPSD